MSTVNIGNQTLANIQWKEASLCCFELTGRPDIFKINTASFIHLMPKFLTLLTGDEAARATRFMRTGDRNRFVIGRAVLKILIGRYLSMPPALLKFYPGDNKKPYVDRPPIPLQFNLSHSGDWIIIAIDKAEIGIDIEYIKPDYEYHEVMGECFGDDEIEHIQNTSPIDTFFLLWTRKEALIKATGKGLVDELRAINCLDGIHPVEATTIGSNSDWQLRSFNVAESYIATVCCQPAAAGFSFWKVEEGI